MIIWKPIDNFTNYAVSNTGLVKNIRKDKLLAFSIKKCTNTSYQRVTLFKEGHRNYRSVHQLVARAFLPNPNHLPSIDHIDTNGLNNNLSNLEWVTHSTNIRRSFKTNPEKYNICSRAGKAAAIVMQKKAEQRYEKMLGIRFIKFYPQETIHKDAAVCYACTCGTIRIASIMWKELRNHKGKCPVCTNTVNRSSKSIEVLK